jgi:hypothetical protein
MNYLQTDDRDDYFDSKSFPKKLKTITYDLITPDLGQLFTNVRSKVIRKYYKDKYKGSDKDAQFFWKEKLTELGYDIKPNQKQLT